jgi:hypothetical protein
MATNIVTNTHARLYTVVLSKGKLDLVPGHNSVDAEAWEEAKKHPMVRHRLKDGHLVEGAAPMPAVETPTTDEDLDDDPPEGGKDKSQGDPPADDKAKGKASTTVDTPEGGKDSKPAK